MGLHANSKQNHRFTLSVNAITKIPEKFVPKKYSMTSKVAQTSNHFFAGTYKHFSRYLTQRVVANVQLVEILTTATSTFAVPSLVESSLCSGMFFYMQNLLISIMSHLWIGQVWPSEQVHAVETLWVFNSPAPKGFWDDHHSWFGIPHR